MKLTIIINIYKYTKKNIIDMIDSKILNHLKSRNLNPGYSILITDYENTEDCNQEKLIIKLHQVNKTLSEIEDVPGARVLEKELIIESNMDYDVDNQAIRTRLIGYSNYNGAIQPTEESEDDIMSNYVEMVDTILQDEINIEFNRPYVNMPAIIPTIDKKYKSYYKNYDTEFIIDEETNQYTGVTITFNKLKRKKIYPTINLTIIGDTINDGE